uniref:AT3G63300 protein n=1 Tax=Arabidopsis thaliana TaxID=3702 RepID=C0Z3E6_ARATH|nr:AT3G63300 [Arabidopsis thaliana]
MAGTGPKTVGRWLKDRKEKKKEETRTQNAQVHATALRGAATLKARALKEVWNIAAVLPAEKGASSALCGQVDTKHSDSSFSGELPVAGEDFLGVCNQELLAKGTELLKRTRGGELHWKIVSVYINKAGQAVLKMKSKHVGGTFTKKKKHMVLEVRKDIPAWAGRDLFNGDKHHYFGLKTETKGNTRYGLRAYPGYLPLLLRRSRKVPCPNGWHLNNIS